jgi:hypothetical protein
MRGDDMTDLAPENVLPRTRCGNATYIIQQVRELGLNPHPSSRLMQMHRVLNSGFIRFEDPRFPTALEAERDLQQLGFVFDQLQSHRHNPEFKALVKKALKDSVLPQDNRQESVGRNSQFHLYLAAVCQNAGLVPVGYDEPDVSCTIDGKKFGIAAKRIKSMDQIKGHIKKAAEQICRGKRPGIIALELSLAWNPKNVPIVSPLESQMYDTISVLQGEQLFDKYHEDIYRWVGGQHVLAVLVFDFRIRLRPNSQWGLDGMSTWLDATKDDEQAKREYKLFYDRFLTGVPNLKHVDNDCER